MSDAFYAFPACPANSHWPLTLLGKAMRAGLFLLMLYGIDFAVDSSFGSSAWAQEWGNTLSISQPSAAPHHFKVLDSADTLGDCLRCTVQPALPLPTATPSHHGADLVYAFLTIRC
jgi:hypothetical protein